MHTRLVIAALAAAALSTSAAIAAPPDAPAPRTVQTVNFGQGVTMSAKSPVNEPNLKADVYARACGFDAFVQVATATVRADGTFIYKTSPTLNTLYMVLIRDRQVVNLSVRVRPAVRLRQLTGNRYRVEVTTGNGSGLDKRTVALQRKFGNRWKPVGTVTLKLISPVDAIDAVAAGNGAARGSGPIRAALSKAQAAPCFAPTASAPLG
jgi:hypothetical protein